jgi:K+-transporting ATPase ATPase B chain
MAAIVCAGTLAVLGSWIATEGGDLSSYTLAVPLLGALLPTATTGILLLARVAGIDRLLNINIVAKSGRAVEAAGRVGTVLARHARVPLVDRRRSAAMPWLEVMLSK